MSWVKHPDAIRAYQERRGTALAEVKKSAKRLREELECPDCLGFEIPMLGAGLLDDIKRFERFRAAVGGDIDVDLKPYFDLVLDAVPGFKWRAHVRQDTEHRSATT